MSYVRTLTICLLLVYFVTAAGCHCFDLINDKKSSEKLFRWVHQLSWGFGVIGTKCRFMLGH